MNQTGPLPSDIIHNIKLYLAKEFVIAPVFSFTLGASFTANSGPPINALGATRSMAPDRLSSSNQGSAGRLPWVTSFDLKMA